jgi:O-antigen/teichoic acid export membrane protein
MALKLIQPSSVEQPSADPWLEMGRPRLSKSFSWTFTGNAIYGACQWGMVMALAKLGSPELVGQFALGMAICAPIWLFSNLHLREVQATDARRECRFGEYLALRLATAVGAILIISLVAYAAGYRREMAMIVIAIGFMRGLESLEDVFYGLLQQHERMDRICKSLLIKGPLALFALGVGFYVTRSVAWGAGCAAVAIGLVLVLYDLRGPALVLGSLGGDSFWSGIPKPHWDARRLAEMAKLALPLGFVTTLTSLTVNIPRYFLEHYSGQRELGIFAAMSYLMLAGTAVVVSLGQAASSRLAQHYSSGNRLAFSDLLTKLIAIAAVLGIGGVVVVVTFGQRLLKILYGLQYAGNNDVFIWLMVAAGIGYVCTFLAYAMTAARCFKPQFPLFFLVALSAFVSCAWLVPRDGMFGAAIALAIAMIIQLLGSCVIVSGALARQGVRIGVGASVPLSD